MTELNIVFDYKGFKFNTCVKVNHTSERTPNGKKFHQITVNDLGHGNFYKQELVETGFLEEKIEELEQAAKDHADNKQPPTPYEVTRLQELGFK